MARIRTIKPEAFASESLAAVSLSAERTFFGLLTQADDHGRFRDQAAVITGLLWSLRPDHSPMDVENDLAQLADADLICRYAGQDGKRYLHIVTWHLHQKINRPSGVRNPACPHHDTAQNGVPSPRTRGAVTEDSLSPHVPLSEGSRNSITPSVNLEGPGQKVLSDSSVNPHGGLREYAVSPQGPDLGPRILDLGSVPSGGASAPAPEIVSARQLIREYVTGCAHRPPEKFLGHLGREINELLAERIDPAHIRAALDRLRTKGLSPSVLPSLVNEVMNAPAAAAGKVRQGFSATVHRHTPWTNPTDPAAYDEEL
ncbi:hypothetical protein ACFXJ5_06820 [Streptomyces sp. NPDC059373]